MASNLKKTVIGIGVATLTTLAGVIATSMFERFIAPFDLEVDAQYIDAAGANHPAVGVVLDLPVVSTATTDQGGRAYWKDVVPHWTEQKQIVVDPPYEIVSAPPLFLRRYSNPLNVLLRKTETQQAAAAPAPAPPTAAQPGHAICTSTYTPSRAASGCNPCRAGSFAEVRSCDPQDSSTDRADRGARPVECESGGGGEAACGTDGCCSGGSGAA